MVSGSPICLGRRALTERPSQKIANHEPPPTALFVESLSCSVKVPQRWQERAFPVGISIEGGQRYISRTRHEPVAFPRTIPLPGRLLVPAIRRELDHLSIAPDLDGQALPSVLDKHSLHSRFERHFGALFQRPVQ